MSWNRRRAWHHSLGRLLGWLALCLTGGALSGHALAGLSLGLASALGWHYWQIHLLLRRLDARRLFADPEGEGLFAEIQARLFQRQRESRRRKQRLQALLRAFRQAASALPDAIVVLAWPSLRIAWFNDAGTALLGLRRPSDIGARLPHLLRAPRVSEWLQQGAAEALLDLPSPIDPERRLQLMLVDYTDEQRLLVVRDVSKLMHLERMRRDFVANVSHELRTPLTVLHGYLDLIDTSEVPALAPQLLAMREQAERMRRIVEDLLTLSRLEATTRVRSERVPMQAMLASLLEDARMLSRDRHDITLEDMCHKDLLGSHMELHSAFSNLVSNAVRYTPAGGRIGIVFRPEPNGGARLEVWDTGPGIPAQHLARITERFYRVSASRSRESGGTGLGLAIVKHALNLHHAKLEIHSEVGKGSRFACVFGPEHVLDAQPQPHECSHD